MVINYSYIKHKHRYIELIIYIYSKNAVVFIALEFPH